MKKVTAVDAKLMFVILRRETEEESFLPKKEVVFQINFEKVQGLLLYLHGGMFQFPQCFPSLCY